MAVAHFRRVPEHGRHRQRPPSTNGQRGTAFRAASGARGAPINLGDGFGTKPGCASRRQGAPGGAVQERTRAGLVRAVTSPGPLTGRAAGHIRQTASPAASPLRRPSVGVPRRSCPGIPARTDGAAQPLVVNLDRARLFRWLFVGLAVTQVLLAAGRRHHRGAVRASARGRSSISLARTRAQVLLQYASPGQRRGAPGRPSPSWPVLGCEPVCGGVGRSKGVWAGPGCGPEGGHRLGHPHRLLPVSRHGDATKLHERLGSTIFVRR